jgi:hypothetical protein
MCIRLCHCKFQNFDLYFVMQNCLSLVNTTEKLKMLVFFSIDLLLFFSDVVLRLEFENRVQNSSLKRVNGLVVVLKERMF